MVTSKYDQKLENYMKDVKSEMIKKTQELIQIPSVYSFSSDPKKPFGENVNSALEYMLNLGRELGFRTKNLDGYCGYIEFGEGEDLVGIIGHLDVVPQGEGWTFPPFSGTIADNKIFGRGAIDDKGPIISSLYAMKAVMETANVKKRIRLILGLDEERHWDCINHYQKLEELPSVSFSPDSDFPCIYAEKLIASISISMPYSSKSSPFSISEIDCHENAINVVPKFCSLVLTIQDQKISIDEVISVLQKILKQSQFEITIYQLSDTQIKLSSYGVQSHAAHPDLGINAISRLLITLYDLFEHYQFHIGFLDFFHTYLGTEYDGNSLGLNVQDESGNLTLNVGHFSLTNEELRLKMNLRIPISTSLDLIKETFQKAIKTYPDLVFQVDDVEPYLYVEKENPLVQTLCQIFNETTHSHAEPIAIGGATYARAFPNCVSFGPNFPGHVDMCHQTDEFIEIDQLLLSCLIYAKAILALGN